MNFGQLESTLTCLWADMEPYQFLWQVVWHQSHCWLSSLIQEMCQVSWHSQVAVGNDPKCTCQKKEFLTWGWVTNQSVKPFPWFWMSKIATKLINHRLIEIESCGSTWLEHCTVGPHCIEFGQTTHYLVLKSFSLGYTVPLQSFTIVYYEIPVLCVSYFPWGLTLQDNFNWRLISCC